MSASPQLADKVDVTYDPLNDFTEVVDPKQNAGLIATFYKYAEKNNFKSGMESRPIFDEKVFLRIERVGDKLSVNEREATEFDKQRFKDEYDAFLRGDNQIHGVPIETLGGLSVGRIAELKAVRVHTIDALAAAPDSALRLIGNDALSLRERARTFMAAIKENESELAINELRQETEKGGGRMAVLEEAVSTVQGQIEGITGMLQQILQGQNQAAQAAQPPLPPLAAAAKTETSTDKDVV